MGNYIPQKEKSFWRCLDCGSDMTGEGEIKCLRCGRVYPQDKGVIRAMPIKIDTLSRQEALYYDKLEEDSVEAHQLKSWRNLFYHYWIARAVEQTPQGGWVLEIGAGSCFDAARIASFCHSVITDISFETLCRARTEPTLAAVRMVAADGAKLPFISDFFDGVYMIATLHHFANPYVAVEELHRVLKKQGMIVIGVEPNALYFRFIKKLRPLLCHAVSTDQRSGSRADAAMTGFSRADLLSLFPVKQWADTKIKPMWLLAGFMHYVLEFLFRLFKLKGRLHLPFWIERAIVFMDEFLLSLPILRLCGWHWILTARKK